MKQSKKRTSFFGRTTYRIRMKILKPDRTIEAGARVRRPGAHGYKKSFLIRCST